MKKKRLKGVPSWDFFLKLLMIMKLSVFIVFLTVFSATASVGYSQSAKLSLEMKNSTINSVLRAIEDQSEFRFFYSEDIDTKQTVSVNFKESNIIDILDAIFKDTDVTYKIVGRQVALYNKTENEMVFPWAQQQPAQINGKVTDTNRQPLPGVTVIEKGTTNGTVTNVNGEYSLSNISPNAVLQFSFVGMKTQEIPVENKTTINIMMEEEAIGIEEVVAIGYGTQKKVNLTGAINTISSDVLEKRPLTSTGEGLQGVIPNLNITFNDGDPSSNGIDFNIRGFESINGGSPLILVDGTPMDIQNINPNDIKSITTLKDASAAAIYGARAAFGVILVTTKEGTATGKVSIQYSYELSVSKPIMDVDLIDNSYDYVFYKNLARRNAGNAPAFTDEYIAKVKAYYENPNDNPQYGFVNGQFEFYGYNDYRKLMLRNLTPSQKHNLNISGKSDKAKYYVSFGYLNKEGVIKYGNDEFERFNILMKADETVTDWLSLDQKIAFNRLQSDKPHIYKSDSNGLNGIVFTKPNTPIKFPRTEEYPEYEGMYFDNIIGYFEKGGRDQYVYNDLWLTTGLNLKPGKNFNIRSEFSYNIKHDVIENVASKIQFVNQNLSTDQDLTYSITGSDWIDDNSGYSQYYVFNTYGEYELDNDGDHYVKAMIGFNQEWSLYKSHSSRGYNLITPEIPAVALTLGQQQIGGVKNQLALRGAFYRLNYIYKDKYLVEFNGRYDGTSRFPENDRFGFFPSISAGWRISNESFMDGTSQWLDNLKIRGSYGELGNQLTTDQNGSPTYYPYISSMSVGLANFVMDNSRIQVVNAPNLVSPSLTWETVATTNFGVDATLFNQHLDASFDWYTRSTKDMLMDVTYPHILGTEAPDINAADLKTNGWELSLTWRDKLSGDFSYDVRLSLWDSQSEITRYDNPTGSLDEYYVGQSIGEIWGYETSGFFQSEEEVASSPDQSYLGNNWAPGDIRYTDLDGDEAINRGENRLEDHGDLKVIGNTTPRYSYGITLNTNYKNWSLGLFFQGIGKKDYYPDINTNGWFWPFDVNANYQKHHITESWTEDNRNSYFYRPTDDAQKNKAPQTHFLQNASYIRLKNISLSYTVPHEIIQKVGLTQGVVYISGQNLWEYSKIHRPLDPEAINSSQILYPFQRTFSVGVNLVF